MPVRPTALGTVMVRKNVARPVCCGLGRDQVGAHVLDDVDAVVGEQDRVHRERLVRVLAGDHLDRPGVGADHDHLLRCQPLRRRLADARLAAVVGRVLRRELLEQVAPAGVDEHRVAFAQRHIVHLQARLQVGLGDDRARVEAGPLQAALVFSLLAAWNTLTTSMITPRVAKLFRFSIPSRFR